MTWPCSASASRFAIAASSIATAASILAASASFLAANASDFAINTLSLVIAASESSISYSKNWEYRWFVLSRSVEGSDIVVVSVVAGVAALQPVLVKATLDNHVRPRPNLTYRFYL